MENVLTHQRMLSEQVQVRTALWKIRIPLPPIYNGPVLAALVQETPTGGCVVAVRPVDEAIASEAAFDINAGSLTALLERKESGQLRTRWNEIQGKFVTNCAQPSNRRMAGIGGD